MYLDGASPILLKMWVKYVFKFTYRLQWAPIEFSEMRGVLGRLAWKASSALRCAIHSLFSIYAASNCSFLQNKHFCPEESVYVLLNAALSHRTLRAIPGLPTFRSLVQSKWMQEFCSILKPCPYVGHPKRKVFDREIIESYVHCLGQTWKSPQGKALTGCLKYTFS